MVDGASLVAQRARLVAVRAALGRQGAPLVEARAALGRQGAPLVEARAALVIQRARLVEIRAALGRTTAANAQNGALRRDRPTGRADPGRVLTCDLRGGATRSCQARKQQNDPRAPNWFHLPLVHAAPRTAPRTVRETNGAGRLARTLMPRLAESLVTDRRIPQPPPQSGPRARLRQSQDNPSRRRSPIRRA